MPRERDQDSESLGEALFEAGAAGFNAPASPEPGEARDPGWLRWVKFLAIIVVLAVVVGLGFLFADYFTQSYGQTYSERVRARQLVEQDTWVDMRFRFFLGAALGGGVGVVYTLRCLLKRSDP